jgi:hypothetical protein
VALSVAWQTAVTLVGGTNGTVNTIYTVPSASTVAYGAYARDLVIGNTGAVTIFVTLNPTSTTSSSTASFQVPSGGSVILTQCQVPAGAVVGAAVGGATPTGQVSVGFATNVNYF